MTDCDTSCVHRANNLLDGKKRPENYLALSDHLSARPKL